MKSECIHVISFSGGKDSTALYLLAMERFGRNFLPVFADTGNEHQDTLDYVHALPEKTGGPGIRRVTAVFTDQDFERKREAIRASWLGDLMTGKAGEWKLKGKWGRERKKPDNTVTIPGPPLASPPNPFRDAETTHYRWSRARSPLSRDQAQRRIQEALEVLQEPTGNPFLDICLLKSIFPDSLRRFCTSILKVEPIMEQVIDPLLEAGHEVVSWQGIRADESARRALAHRIEDVGGGLWLYRPLLDWSIPDVLSMHEKHGITPNPLYTQGMGRVGCMPCINARKGEIREIAHRFPGQIDRIEKWERHLRKVQVNPIGTFFPAKKVPGVQVDRSHVRAVVEWSKTGKGGWDMDMFADEEDDLECKNSWGLCESPWVRSAA